MTRIEILESLLYDVNEFFEDVNYGKTLSSLKGIVNLDEVFNEYLEFLRIDRNPCNDKIASLDNVIDLILNNKEDSLHFVKEDYRQYSMNYEFKSREDKFDWFHNCYDFAIKSQGILLIEFINRVSEDPYLKQLFINESSK
jgi:hypothetical protein